MTSLSPTIRQIQPFYRNLYQTSGKKPENIESGEAALLSSKAVPTTFKTKGFLVLNQHHFDPKGIQDKA